MYRDAVDQATRNDTAAATAAHHELGRDYDSAIAESLVDRIGAEIDTATGLTASLNCCGLSKSGFSAIRESKLPPSVEH